MADKLKRHIMIDLETWGLAPDSVILSIGAVAFDPLGTPDQFDRFEVAIDPIDSVREGFKMDPGTVMWWMHPDRALAREALLNMSRADVRSALDWLAAWMDAFDVQGLWGNGATMDNTLLEYHYKKLGMIKAWTYKQDRCYRTLNSLKPWVDYPPIPEGLVEHTALGDATMQALHMMEIAKARPELFGGA